ncbi:MAG TPA: hypothetical protein VLW53_11995 [Candidatus Eisenbacteria bacterium]|nr:hypothetical protein [Candidatus Eisenbacteria bacterium]
MTRLGLTRDTRSGELPPRVELGEPLWVRVGGGMEEVTSGRRHGPADPAFPPPGGPWDGLWSNGRLVGWALAAGPGRASPRRAQAEGERIGRERRARLLGRLGHKLRNSVLALQESARQAAFGRQELLEDIYEMAQDVGRRALAMEAVGLDPKDPPRAVVIGAVLNLAAGPQRLLPDDAVVRASEPVLRDALTRACEWMGGAGCTVSAELAAGWWRLEVIAAPARRPLPVPEMGEPLVRHLVDMLLEGWLDSSVPDRAAIYLPAG